MDIAKLTTAACISYAANVTLGFGVATKLVDTGKAKWVHHGLYISTLALTGAVVWSSIGPIALSARSALARKPRGVIAGREAAGSLPPVRPQGAGNRRKNKGGLAGWLLMPAFVPLAAISTIDARSPAHPLVALIAAPFYGGAAVVAAIASVRKRKDRAKSHARPANRKRRR